MDKNELKSKTSSDTSATIVEKKSNNSKKPTVAESIGISIKNDSISSMIDSWLSSYDSIDLYNDDKSKQKDSNLDKYIPKSYTSGLKDPIPSKNSSPLTALDTSDTKPKPSSTPKSKQLNNSQANTNSNSGKPKITTIHDILGQGQTKKKNFVSSQNYNSSNRYNPYNEPESKSNSISKPKLNNYSNNNQSKKSMFD
ncbi:myb domain-containing protein [Tieghemostelium lacteum]|uniref:Myb domain-containing protein n=1 Tax=Tieghemostelium lacteum TaxID=361077 RepID=A0A151Z9R7_TIELA|nr:myb domain-containing protein [Tieghemostelium lacteum]|eukprot:KYQ90698.1 myb domain-containing protein [Tieghemostelium lacteum]